MKLYSQWTEPIAADAAAVRAIATALGVSPVTAELLVARGCETVADARAFLQADPSSLHDPYLMPDMAEAVQRIGRALDEGERIGIYGDYDVDGQTSTALLVRGLTALGAEPRWYIPERVAEGYGLNVPAIERLAAEGVRLLITVDCGSGAAEETARAKQLGMDVIITDHHEAGDGDLVAAAFMNPKRADSRYPFRELAGVGVALKLMQSVWRDRGMDGFPPYAFEYAALGTVADVCPLVGENRVLVKKGLKRLNGGSVPALSALADVCGVEQGQVSATRIAFGLAPRLNAAGRVGHAELGVRLLLSDDYDEALVIARKLDEENTRRREMEARIVEEAVQKVEQQALLSDWVLVVAGEGWHPGVIGIVASRLVERYARPAVVIGLDGEVGTGSARSIDAFDLHEGLTACAHHLRRYGGHRMAAGLTVQRDAIETLRVALNEYAADVLAPEDLVPRTRVDGEVRLDDVTEVLAQELEQLGPFGMGNPTPVLAARDALVIGARTVGKQSDHLKLTLKDEATDAVHEAMAFGSGALLDAIVPGSEVHVAFALRLGEWRGRPQLTLNLRALQSPLSVAESKAALDVAPTAVTAPPVSDVRGGPVPVVDRRQQAASHPLARVAYLAPLADSGARIVVVIGPGEDAEAIVSGVAHTLHVDARAVSEGMHRMDTAAPRVLVVAPASEETAPKGEDRSDGWGGRGHLVLFGLPAREETLWSLLADAGAASGWTVHLAYDAVGVQASAAALARRYPDEYTMRIVYRALGTPAARRGGLLPPAEDVARVIEAESPGVVDASGVAHALSVFEQLGLVQSAPGGLRLVPQHGRKVDVATAERYNIGIHIQKKFAANSRIALDATPAALLALAVERSSSDGFTIPHPGSPGFSETGS